MSALFYESKFIGSRLHQKKVGMIYGQASSGKENEMTVKECYDIYKFSLSRLTDIKTLNKDYMIDEEIAFVNALLFYCKENYYRPYETEGKNWFYHEQDYTQLPFTYYCTPLLQQLFVGNAIYNIFEKNPFGYLARGILLFIYFILIGKCI